MEAVINFLKSEVFSIGDFAVAWGLFIAVVVVLLAIIILICVVSKHAKRKKQNKIIAEMINEPQESVKEQEQTQEPIVDEKSKKEAVQEKPVKKTPAKKPAKKTEDKPQKRLLGKWIIVKKKDNEYMSKLLASNGEVMLSSEIYSTADGAKSGVATIIKGVENGNFIIYCDKSGAYYYKLKSASNKLLCAGEIYKTKDGCDKAVESVKRIASASPIVSDIVEGEEYIEYLPTPLNLDTGKKLAKGKWKIEKGENGYSAKLYANNGQLMISTEGVSQKATAEKAVLAVKKNSLEGNFIIDKDKFGRFYYKLRNSQKSVICIGEAYEKLDACISALESVRRFAEISQIEK